LDFPGAYLKVPQNKWWDDYNGEEDVLIEDFDASDEYMGKFFKQWVDRYAFRVEVKRGGMVIRPKRIIITSNWSIDQCFKDDKVRKPIERRFHQVEFTQKIDESKMPKPIKRQRLADCILEKRFPGLKITRNERIFGPSEETQATMDRWGVHNPLEMTISTMEDILDHPRRLEDESLLMMDTSGANECKSEPDGVEEYNERCYATAFNFDFLN
jgi:hypothetical protein